ncbi:MAG: type III-D CRISPR-associated protein Csx19 [Promethearchaeota archaeon]
MSEIYEIKNLSSKIEVGSIEKNFQKIKKLIFSNFNNGSIVCWLNHRLLFGNIINKEFIFVEKNSIDFNKHLLRLRVFNDQKEILIQKRLNDFQYRLREDNNGGKNQEYIDAEQIIFGTKSKPIDNKFSEVIEDRGIKIIIPSDWLQNKQLSLQTRLILKTRNYLDYNNYGQISIIDCRFIEITVKE